jgi:hypothetical protein
MDPFDKLNLLAAIFGLVLLYSGYCLALPIHP